MVAGAAKLKQSPAARSPLNSFFGVNGDLETSPTGVIEIAGDSGFQFVRIVDGKLSQVDGSNLVLFNYITNNGTYTMNSTGNMGSPVTVEYYGSVDLRGSSEFNLTDSAYNVIEGDSFSGQPNILTNTANHTIRGSGKLGDNLSTVINQGTIIAEGTTGMTFEPKDQLTWTNAGTVRVEEGSQLKIQGNKYENTSVTELTSGSLLTQDAGNMTYANTNGDTTLASATITAGNSTSPEAAFRALGRSMAVCYVQVHWWKSVLPSGPCR